jgi:hypothetical protein
VPARAERKGTENLALFVEARNAALIRHQEYLDELQSSMSMLPGHEFEDSPPLLEEEMKDIVFGNPFVQLQFSSDL